jgi:chorismate synthase
VVVQRSSGQQTVARVEAGAVRAGWVKVVVDPAGSYKEMDPKDVRKLVTQL